MKIIKIGKGYYQSGYGKGFKKNPIIRLINGKAYAKDSTAFPFQTDLDGYVMEKELTRTVDGFGICTTCNLRVFGVYGVGMAYGFSSADLPVGGVNSVAHGVSVHSYYCACD